MSISILDPDLAGKILVICLGSSAEAAQCFNELTNLIDDVHTVLEHVQDDSEADRIRSEAKNLPNGEEVSDTCICIVITHDGEVEGSVPSDEGSLTAFALWASAKDKRDGGGQ